MMSFELETPTRAKVVEVYVLSQKNRKPDEDPGAKLTLEVLVGNDMLSGFHNSLKGDLFTRDANSHAADPQGTLDGVPVVSDLPDLTWLGEHVKTLKLVDSMTGYQLQIEHSIGGRPNIVIDDCTISGFRLQAQKGGTVLVKFELESPDVSAVTWGKLARLKSLEVEIVLLAPHVEQQDMDEEPAPRSRAAPAPAPDATSAFLAAHGREGDRP
jgi:hypothetical protein